MKKIFISILTVILVLSGAGLVYGAYINFSKHIEFVSSSSESIISDSENLSSVVLVFQSNINIKNSYVYSQCNTKTEYITNDEDLYFFKFSLLDSKCANPYFSLKKGEEIFVNTNFSLEIKKHSDIYSMIIDYPTKQISVAQTVIQKKIKKYAHYQNLKETQGINFIPLLKKQRIYNELVYKLDAIDKILQKRGEKYSIPVKGYEISDGLNVIPNADRSYRKDYTDGIHHGWDIMAPIGTPVSAIDDGIIIRVVSDFQYEDLSNIKKGINLTHSDKLRNLDILRGSQVWLKTMKGDVIFYSHLDVIYENIKEGLLIKEGTDIGTIGVSGVPDRNYTNFHLHFPIQKNPHLPKKAGKYSFEDVMNWDWYLKGLDVDSVIKGKDEIFKEPDYHNH